VALGALLAALLCVGLWRLSGWSRAAAFGLVPAAAVAALARSVRHDTLPREQLLRESVATTGLLLFAVAVVAVLARRDFGRTMLPSSHGAQKALRAISILTAVSGLLALTDVATLFVLSGLPPSAPDPLWWALPMLAALTCARLATGRPDRLALGFAMGLCVCHVLLMAPFLRVVPLLFMYGASALPFVAMLPLSGVGLAFGSFRSAASPMRARLESAFSWRSSGRGRLRRLRATGREKATPQRSRSSNSCKRDRAHPGAMTA
jgi:hypothetical protein